MVKLSDQDKQITGKNYDIYTKLHMEDGWAANHKIENFKLMMHLIDLTDIALQDTSCLDVGCGTGDFSAFARKFGATTYLGIDIYEQAIIKAREKYPLEKFIVGDFLEVKLAQTFDYAFCSGGLTIKLSTDNYLFFEETIKKMWQSTNIGIVCNILIDTDTSPDPDLFFYNQATVIGICKEIDNTAKIQTSINPTRAEMHLYMYR